MKVEEEEAKRDVSGVLDAAELRERRRGGGAGCVAMRVCDINDAATYLFI